MMRCLPSNVGRTLLPRNFALRGVPLILAIMCLFPQPSVTAQEPFEQLRQRVERLEEENLKLRAIVERHAQPTSFEEVPPTPATDDVETAADEDVETAAEEERIGSIVEKYLRRRDVPTA